MGSTKYFCLKGVSEYQKTEIFFFFLKNELLDLAAIAGPPRVFGGQHGGCHQASVNFLLIFYFL